MTELNTKQVRDLVERVVREHGIVGDYEVNVYLASTKEMAKFHHKYMAEQGYEGEYHDVLSFPLDLDVSIPDGIIRLGDILVCDQEKDVEFLIKHGCLHLLGIHHE